MNKNELHRNFEMLTRLSYETNKEIGVCVCGENENNLYLDDVLTIGSSSHGAILCTCSPIQKLFHTHPIGTAHPSREDIQSLAKSNLRQGEYCIGAMENGKPKVKCYNITKLLKQPI